MNNLTKLILISISVTGIIVLFWHKSYAPQDIPVIKTMEESSIISNTVSESVTKDERPPIRAPRDPFWASVTQEQILNALSGGGQVSEDIFIAETLDLTGDSVPEGISLRESYPYNYNIFLKNSDNSIQTAKQKDKDGRIHIVSLTGFARGPIEEGYEFLPEEHGYYVTYLNGEDTGGILICNTDSVQTYTWNSKTKLFEYNDKLTQKYHSKFCLDYK